MSDVASPGTVIPEQGEIIAPREHATDTVVVLDFGSQYSRLIARRVREAQVYCEVLPYDTPWERIRALNPGGVILSGGPASVYEPSAPRCTPEVFSSGVPMLGICYGFQLMARQLGGTVAPATRREYGRAVLHVLEDNDLFANMPRELPVWMSHGDHVVTLPPGFRAIARTDSSPSAAVADDHGHIGIQFHPEVVHTAHGLDMLRNFATRVCGITPTWTPRRFIDEAVDAIRQQVAADDGATGRVLCALSGGVDSAVAAALLARALGDRVVCVFVDNGLLRQDEAKQIEDVFTRVMPLNLVHVDASNRFLRRLAGVVDPEQKRRIIGDEFINVFRQEAETLGDITYLAQGTLYPDVIESTSHDTVGAAKIKTHHNVGGLPEHLPFTLIEPLRYLFKDEVRRVGLELGLPESMIWRQPFPGPGLAVRILGDVTPERLDIVRRADHIVVTEVKAANLYRSLWQSFAILTPLQSVGVMGDHRTYAYVVAVRAVTSEDAMTADWAQLPPELLARISNRIVNEIPEVNRVVYDITSKPPGTIEWE